MRRKLVLIFLCNCPSTIFSQELNCRVVINADQIQTTERSIFKEMEVAFAEFMNNTKWTEDEFELEERIKCNIILNLSSMPSSGQFEASVQVISSRPVYNTDYETILFNFADRDWSFEYVPSQPLAYNQNTYVNNLSSLLSFYAYVILGLDYDSFGEKGGDPHFKMAEQILINAQQSQRAGWNQFNSVRSRYWLIDNILSSQLNHLRLAYYQYHRQGLDVMSKNEEEGRKNILESIKKLYKANKSRPRSIFTISFLDAKSIELAQVFTKGQSTQRKEAYNLLTSIDPTKTKTFEPMINN